MIVRGLMDVIFPFFSFILGAVKLPKFPESFMGYVDTTIDYLRTGVQILGNYVDLGYLVLLIQMFIGMWLGLELWKIVFWVLRKIPILNIK